MVGQCWFQKPGLTKQKCHYQVCKTSMWAAIKEGSRDPNTLQVFDTFLIFPPELDGTGNVYSQI